MKANQLVFEPSGVVALADGTDLLAHGGSDERPLWRQTLPAEIVALGAARGVFVALERGGRVTFWAPDGAPLGSQSVAADADGLAVSPDGRFVVLAGGTATLHARGGEGQPLPVAEATAAAFSRDGSALAVGTKASELRLFSGAGVEAGVAATEAPVRSVAPRPSGWLVAAGERILRVGPTGQPVERVTRAGGMEPDLLAVSPDGALFAARLSESLVMCLGDPPQETVAQLTYIDRKISGVAFGPERLFFVGLVGGDANYVDIAGKELRRTDPFEGRAMNRWMVKVVIEPDAAPPVASPTAASPASQPAPAPPAAPSPAPRASGPSRAVAALGVLLCLALLAGAAWLKVSSDEQNAKQRRDEQMRRDIQRSIQKNMPKTPR